MKRESYQILMVAAIAAMMLVPLAPCGAAWQYLGSYVPNTPTYDSDGDGSTWHWEYSYSANTSAGSGGVSASGFCHAKTWVRVSVSDSGPTEMSRSASAEAATWGESYYADFAPYNWLYVNWSVSGSGTVECSGGVDDTRSSGTASVYTDSSADGYIGANDGGDGYGSAEGSASTAYALGNAGVTWGGYAEESSSSGGVGYGTYSASLTFSVQGSGSWDDDTRTQFTAKASVYAGASSYASASLTEGTAYAGSDSHGDCGGSASVSVSY